MDISIVRIMFRYSTRRSCANNRFPFLFISAIRAIHAGVQCCRFQTVYYYYLRGKLFSENNKLQFMAWGRLTANQSHMIMHWWYVYVQQPCSTSCTTSFNELTHTIHIIRWSDAATENGHGILNSKYKYVVFICSDKIEHHHTADIVDINTYILFRMS